MCLNKEADNTVSNSTLKLTFQTIDILLNAAFMLYTAHNLFIFIFLHTCDTSYYT